MTTESLIIAIVIMSVTTFFTRLFPFVVFDLRNSKPSPVILYLGKYLPPTIISAIIVYSFKDVSFTAAPFATRELIAVAVCVLLQLWRKNTLISIFVSTGVYMLLSHVM